MAQTAEPTVYDTITETMDQLMHLRRMKHEQLWRAMGLTKPAYYARRSGATKWTVADVKRAADALGVSVATLYDGLDLTALGLPQVDSNHQPADFLPVVEGVVFPFPRSLATARDRPRQAVILPLRRGA